MTSPTLRFLGGVLLLLAGVLAGCGSGQPTQDYSAVPLPEAKSQDEILATEDPEIVEQREKVFEPALQVVGISKLHVEALDSFLLFDADRIEGEKIVARWARAIGFQVIDPELLEQTVAKAAEGKNPKTNESCGPALDRTVAIKRWMPDHGSKGHLKIYIICDQDCHMRLSLSLDGRGTEFFAAPFDTSKPWNEELARALRKLVDNGGHGRHGHANNPVGLKGIERTTPEDMDQIYDQDDGNPMPSGTIAQASRCGADFYGISLLADKEKGRCERYMGLNIVSDSDRQVNECMCKALLSDPEVKTGLNAYIWHPTIDPRPTHKSSNGKEISAFASSDGRYSQNSGKDLWFFPDCEGVDVCDDLGHCFTARATVTPSTRLDIGIAFDSDGRATEADILDDDSFLTASEKSCVVKKLMTARIPCPDDTSTERFTRRSWMDVEIR